jgi:hypothetical protein
MEKESSLHEHIPLASDVVLSLISEACSVPRAAIVWATQWGSRLFSLSHSHSDYDIVCALSGYLGPLATDTTLSPRERHYANVVCSNGKGFCFRFFVLFAFGSWFVRFNFFLEMRLYSPCFD